jgi:hypothetical protein
MSNRAFNPYPKAPAAAAVFPQAGALAEPAWWGAADEAHRNAAERGCPAPETNCAVCRIARCPDGQRTCRVCAMWASEFGHVGTCEAKEPKRKMPGDTCSMWRARR